MKKIYIHDEPAPIAGNCRIERTEEEVILYMKNMYHFPTKRWPKKQRVLDEYTAVNWAWVEERKDDV